MALPSVAVNYLAIIVATFASFVIGFLWFGPLFGKVWAKEMGFGKKEMNAAKKKGMGKIMLVNFVGTLVTAYVLAVLIGMLGVSTLIDGVKLGFWIWLGFFAAATLLNGMLWEGKSFKLYIINAAFWLVSIKVMASIIAVWG